MDKVDVLAVMDELNETVSSEFLGTRNQDLTGSNLIARGEEARAAVAELIEADKRLDSARDAVFAHELDGGPGGRVRDHEWALRRNELMVVQSQAAKRRAAALARISP